MWTQFLLQSVYIFVAYVVGYEMSITLRRPHDASVSDHRHALTPAHALAVRGSNVCRIERGELPTQPSERIVSASAAVASTGIPLEKIVNAGQY